MLINNQFLPYNDESWQSMLDLLYTFIASLSRFEWDGYSKIYIRLHYHMHAVDKRPLFT